MSFNLKEGTPRVALSRIDESERQGNIIRSLCKKFSKNNNKVDGGKQTLKLNKNNCVALPPFSYSINTVSLVGSLISKRESVNSKISAIPIHNTSKSSQIDCTAKQSNELTVIEKECENDYSNLLSTLNYNHQTDS